MSDRRFVLRPTPDGLPSVVVRPPVGPDGLPDGFPDAYGIPSLGWGVLAWAEEYLAQPDGSYAGEDWRWTKTQARLVAWWYAVDEYGKWLYRRGQVVLPKGAGKSPVSAALGCCELAGEVLFDGWDAAGEPVGRPHPSPHVQIAACSSDQTDNTMTLVLAMLREGKAAFCIDGLDLGLTRVRTRNGLLKPVTASATSREGERTTFACLDETHLWTPTLGGHRLAKVIRRNLGKMGGRSIETTNTWVPGEDSIAEFTAMYADRIAEQLDGGPQTVLDEGLLRYHPRANVRNLGDLVELRAGLEQLYHDSPWIDIDRIMAEVLDPATHPAEARRFYLNAVVSPDDAVVTEEQWSACLLDDVLDDGDEICLGFDGSKNEDSTVLVALRVRDRFATVIGAMEKPDRAFNDWEVDRELFDGLVTTTFAQYRVVGFYSDVLHFESYVDNWSAQYGSGLECSATTKSAVGWDMRARQAQSTIACERLVAGIVDGSVHHDGGTLLRRHVLNTRRRPNRWGVSFGKERRDSPRKVDAFAALLLADMARADVIAGRSKKRPRSGRIW